MVPLKPQASKARGFQLQNEGIEPEIAEQLGLSLGAVSANIG
jgi:hypothetical protein